ncbi:MAG: dihydrofolate reductase [Clostridium sp.]|uniref:dihydrofolate reductase n=1 Tax=Clostridium sp. DSM 8431 TaxID=1761781 RepID=UPI0008E29BF8|nr:dihydrofolate reductase [Clostridium sp. DSM 8431]MCR4943263.1 dihydrofolate reductase [Clostridium sp.]SFU74331.1 dihydrofolate reductase [Clostridium sp. DSM 8431]
MFSAIVAVASNNVIGGDNKLLWHISDDLKRFKSITTGHTIIMGRKTFESFPKPLPNRHHVILTRDKNYKVDSDEVTVVHDVETVMKMYENSGSEVFIIGGGEIYNLLLPYCSKLYLTKVNKNFEGDTYFPEINFDEWNIDESSGELINEKDNLSYEFINLSR